MHVLPCICTYVQRFGNSGIAPRPSGLMHFSNYGCTWVYEYYIYSEDCVITPARAARRATKRSPQLDATRAGRQALASSSRRSGDIQGHEQLPHSDPKLRGSRPPRSRWQQHRVLASQPPSGGHRFVSRRPSVLRRLTPAKTSLSLQRLRCTPQRARRAAAAAQTGWHLYCRCSTE